MLICDLNNFFSKEQPKPYSDEIDNDKYKTESNDDLEIVTIIYGWKVVFCILI